MALNYYQGGISRILDVLGGDTDEGVEEIANEQANEVVTDVQAISQGVVKSLKEKDIITFNGHQFWRQYKYKEKIYWECVKVDQSGCRARLHTNINTGQVIKVVGRHSHGASAMAIPLRQLSQQVKQAAVETMERPSTIFNSVLTGVSEAVQAQMDKSAIRKVVQRKRKRVNREPEAPTEINFAIPDAYRNYRFGLNEPEPFLLGDSEDESGNRILLFGRASNKNWSAQMKVVFMDGTFKITPTPFCQVYLILAERGGYVFPVLYALVMNKSQATYQHLFRMIKKIWPDFVPSSISVDFEMAAISALEVCFPDAETWGCLFHLVQNMKKKLSKHGLKGRYDADLDFAIQCRMIIAMAFVKIEEVVPVFEEL